MEHVCVYCGSSPGRDPAYREAAASFGRRLADRGTGVVYGGGDVGLMGALAEATLDAGGEVTGVIPEALVDREAPRGAFQLEVVGSMHERKARMAELADGFAALPGGYGTLEELLEVLTWSQLGFHRKPCGVLNVAGYFDGLVAFLDHAVEEGFVSAAHRELLVVEDDAGALLAAFEAYDPPEVERYASDPEGT